MVPEVKDNTYRGNGTPFLSFISHILKNVNNVGQLKLTWGQSLEVKYIRI